MPWIHAYAWSYAAIVALYVLGTILLGEEPARDLAALFAVPLHLVWKTAILPLVLRQSRKQAEWGADQARGAPAMMEIRMIPDSADQETGWMLDPQAGRIADIGLVDLADATGKHRPDASRDVSRDVNRDVNRQFGRNVGATIVARLVNMARGVCLVPFLLAHIGLEAYGIWTTIFILVTYVGVSTLGISNVYIKYVAEFHARREYDKANALLSTGLAVTIPLCGVIFLCFLLEWNRFAPWLRLPVAHAGDGKEAGLIVLGVFLSSIALNAFGDMLTGTQQIASTQVFLIISIAAECVLIVWLVMAGRGIRGLAEAYLARTVINDGLYPSGGRGGSSSGFICRPGWCGASRSNMWSTLAGWCSSRACCRHF